MKILNSLISKFGGTDKVLHLFLGGWLTSQFDAYGAGIGLIGMLVAVGLDIIKEKYLDESFDLMDVVATFVGCAIELMLWGVRESIFGATGILPEQPF